MEHAKLGHFDLLNKVGEGGMGVVYKARDTSLERIVALKLLPENRLADPERRARFLHEAKAASALNHPNIVTVHEIGEQDGRTFIVMEFVDGKPLNDLIPHKGMRTTEALRVATQVADALTAAHAAGIVHRDLKPGNIMVDAHGRVKVLDFGLAKVTAASAAVAGADETTRTVPMDRPLTEEGAIVGSIPYMSPEQAEGRPVDARSDIFSFGAVLYEMVTGQRAFRGESRISTLAAVVEKDAQPPSATGVEVPPELERLITRCLRKDVERRMQNMADVKLTLEELRDESESGKLIRTAAGVPALAKGHRWLWPAIGGACLLVAAALLGWVYLSRGHEPQVPEMVRLTPDDGHAYGPAAISPDGKFVAYASDRANPERTEEVWLQQVGGGDPIQLTTHSDRYSIGGIQFFPDATRILYMGCPQDGRKCTIEIIPTLGGPPKILKAGEILQAALSPDGRQLAYYEGPPQSSPGDGRLMLVSADGGAATQLSNWHGMVRPGLVWTADGRSLVVAAPRPDAKILSEWEWYAVPVDGGEPVKTGAGDVFAASGLRYTIPRAMTGGRILFYSAKGAPTLGNLWDIRFNAGSRKVAGRPRQLTFLTGNVGTGSVASNGLTPVSVGTASTDLHTIPLASLDGQPAGMARRITRDGRLKSLTNYGGDPRKAYFDVASERSYGIHAVDLESGTQARITPEKLFGFVHVTISRDGRQIAYSIPDGDSYNIALAEAGTGPKDARILCQKCGNAQLFSADGRFLMYQPEAQPKTGPSDRKLTLRLLELASGKDRPWLEHPTESLAAIGWFGQNASWLALAVSPIGSQASAQKYFLMPWRETPVPASEWMDTKLPALTCRPSPVSNFLYSSENGKLMTIRFDPNTRTLGQSVELRFPPGSAMDLGPYDEWAATGLGLVFMHVETKSSVYLMKLPE